MKRSTSITIIFAGIFLLFTACGHERIGCEGEIIVVNEIPDTTLYIGGEPFFRDLFAPPVVLRHTEDNSITLTVLSSDGTIVDAIPARSPTTGRLNAVKVIPLKKEGMVEIRILADDGCEQTEINFTVTVKDTLDN